MEKKKSLSEETERLRIGELDRRKDSQQFVEKRLNELDRRRDITLSEKLAAIEKLFTLTVNTKNEALSIAISRMQGDNRDCLTRCNTQVRDFYEQINSLKANHIRQDMIFEGIAHEFHDHETEKDVVLKDLETRMRVLETWKLGFWTVNVPLIIAAIVASVGAVFTTYGLLMEYIKRLHGGD